MTAGTLVMAGGSVVDAEPPRTTVPAPALRAFVPVAVTPGTLVASPAQGDPYTTVQLTAAVPAGTPDGATVTVRDGDMPLATGVRVSGGVAQISTNALGAGAHTLVARVDGSGAELRTDVSYGNPDTVLGPGDSTTMTLVVRIPPGSVTVTPPVVHPIGHGHGHGNGHGGGRGHGNDHGNSPGHGDGHGNGHGGDDHGAGHGVPVGHDHGAGRGDDDGRGGCAPVRLDGLRVTDTRGSRPGFTVTVRDGSRPTGLVPQQVPGNGLRAADLRRAGPDSSVAHYPAGGSLGSVAFDSLVVHPQREAGGTGRCVGTVSVTLL